MELTVKLEGLQDQTTRLTNLDIVMHKYIARALFRIGGLWKKTAVDYAPISPTTTMLRTFARAIKKSGGRENSNQLYVNGRKGQPGRVVTLTKFYDVRMSMLLSKDPNSTSRPMPGGLMRSIAFTSDDSKVECFVPSNSPAGTYAFKMHEEKGKSWKERGPGTQAKGPQADDKFITRAAKDKESDFTAIVSDEIDKLLGGHK